MANTCSIGDAEQMVAALAAAVPNVNITHADNFVKMFCEKLNTTSAKDHLDQTGASLDGSFTLTSTYLVFFVQAGFALVCAGKLRTNNLMSVVVRNILDCCVAAITFFIFGWGFAYGKGKNSNRFIGSGNFALEGLLDGGNGGWHKFLFHWALASVASMVFSGSVAQRMRFPAYMGTTVFLVGFVYPVVAHWVWSDTGWLSAHLGVRKINDLVLDTGAMDCTGGAVVHLVGGVTGLCGAMVVGPRVGRFDDDGVPDPTFFSRPSLTLITLGTFIMWFGWYGSLGNFGAIDTTANLQVVGRASVCLTLSGGLTQLFRAHGITGHWDVSELCNGVLAGLVGISAGCAVVEPGAAILCGFVAACVYDWSARLLLALRVDDPLSAAPMHGFVGAWGLFYVGFMAKAQYAEQFYGRQPIEYGAFYGGSGKLLGCQICAIVTITLWVVGMMLPLLTLMKYSSVLRVDQKDEEGLDEGIEEEFDLEPDRRPRAASKSQPKAAPKLARLK